MVPSLDVGEGAADVAFAVVGLRVGLDVKLVAIDLHGAVIATPGIVADGEESHLQLWRGAHKHGPHGLQGPRPGELEQHKLGLEIEHGECS